MQNIGEYLGGHALRHSGHDIKFDPESNPEKTESCTQSLLTEMELETFRNAVRHHWFYQMYLDDLPVWGMVGEMLPENQNEELSNIDIKEKDDLDRLDRILMETSDLKSLKPYLYTTRNLLISYNDDQIVKVDLTSDPASLVELKPNVELTFTLQIKWEKTEYHFHSRFDRYLDHEFFKHPIHWFSVFNSFMMVIFLMGLVALIMMRTLKKDYAKYGILYDLDEEAAGDSNKDHLDDQGKSKLPVGVEDAGWKQVHGDVFRAPTNLPLLSALIGSGFQLVTLACGVMTFALLGPLHGEVHEERGKLWQTILTCYILSSVSSGYTSGKFFKMYYPTTAEARCSGGKGGNASGSVAWQATMGLNIMLLPSFVVTSVFSLNAIAFYYGTINALPFMVIFKLFLIWVFGSVPLCIIGTLIGRHTRSASKGGKISFDHFPCRVNAIPRPIPDDVPWYGKSLGLIIISGALSFGSIFIELYYVLTSLWNYKFFHVYGFLLGIFLIMNLVVGMTSIIAVYFLLNAENYHWQWTAFGSGASISIYVYIYTVYYFFFKLQMTGFLQTSYYFGYMTLISASLGLLCGTVGHRAASIFVLKIFQNVKVD